MRLGDTPVPIPNTTVKTRTADGTMLETAWESRWLPDCKKNTAALQRAVWKSFMVTGPARRLEGAVTVKQSAGRKVPHRTLKTAH